VICPTCAGPLPPGRTYCSRLCQCRAVSLAGAEASRRRRRSIDRVVVDRLTSGQTTPATPAERAKATRVLTLAGYSASDIARILGCTERTVCRYRASARDAA